MREFNIAFAQCDNTDLVRPDIADALTRRIVEVYGRCTMKAGQLTHCVDGGGIITESVYILDSATKRDAESVRQFAVMAAAEIRREMGEVCVYFCNVNGYTDYL
jgi:hypothetical protein